MTARHQKFNDKYREKAVSDTDSKTNTIFLCVAD